MFILEPWPRSLKVVLRVFPSIGFSLNDYASDADFSVCGDFIKEVVTKALTEGLTEGVCLNVNIPAVPKEKIKGVKVCRQANARWVEEYEERLDPRNQKILLADRLFRKA